MRLAFSFLLMLASLVAAALMQDDDAQELADQAAEMFSGEAP